VIAKSGSRLKLTWLTTPDGVRVPFESPFAFFDSERNERCVRYPWSDGTLRCTPALTSDYVSGLAYTDSACTTPIIQTGTAGTTQSYFAQYAPSGGLGVLYTPGTEVTTHPSMLWTLVNGACGNPTPVGTIDSDHRYFNGVSVPSTAFVELTQVTASGSDPLEPITYQSADGVLWPTDSAYSTATNTTCALGDTFTPSVGACGSLTLSRVYDTTSTTRLRRIDLTYPPSFVHYDHFMHDTVLGTDCAFTSDLGNGTAVCGPWPTHQIEITPLFSDGACANPVNVIEIIPPDVVSAYAYRQPQGQLEEFHRVGALHPGMLYWGAPGSCERYTGEEAPPNAVFYDVDPAVIGWDQFGSGTITIDP